VLPLLGQPGGASRIQTRDHLVAKRVVRGSRRELSAAADQQCLLERRLESVVALFRDAVFVRLARADPRRPHVVVTEHSREPLGHDPAATLLELARRRRQIVAASNLRHPTQLPQRALQPAHQRLERLAQRDAHVAPSAEAQHELKQQMHERHAGDRDAELGRVCKVELPLAAGWMLLLKVDLLAGTVHGAPVANPTLQCPQLARLEGPGMVLVQNREHGLGLKLSLLVGLE
jgi:hypothetical protein